MGQLVEHLLCMQKVPAWQTLSRHLLREATTTRGKDRCRHFVINCQKNGRYVISGDTRSHQSLAELISYYQTSEIEPFGENLTAACSKPEDKNVYDEISLEQRTPAGQQSSSSPVASPGKKDLISLQPGKSTEKFQEQQKSLSKETEALNLEASLGDDPDAAPPIPERNSLLLAECAKEGLRDEAGVSPSWKRPEDKNLTDTSQAFADHAQNLENTGQGNSYCKSIRTKPFVKSYRKRADPIETGQRPETIYSEIDIEQHKSMLTQPEPQSNPSLSLTVPQKVTLNSPASTPPKLSPKSPNKLRTSTASPAQPQTYAASYWISPIDDKGHRTPTTSATLPGSPRKDLYGQIHKLKSQKPTMSVREDPYEPTQFELSKRRAHGHELTDKTPPKSPPLKPKEAYEQACMKTVQSSRTQSYTENMYERIPLHFPKSHSTGHGAPADDIYEKISFVPGKELWAKPNQKSDKPRRFFFVDKKNKF